MYLASIALLSCIFGNDFASAALEATHLLSLDNGMQVWKFVKVNFGNHGAWGHMHTQFRQWYAGGWYEIFHPYQKRTHTHTDIHSWRHGSLRCGAMPMESMNTHWSLIGPPGRLQLMNGWKPVVATLSVDCEPIASCYVLEEVRMLFTGHLMRERILLAHISLYDWR